MTAVDRTQDTPKWHSYVLRTSSFNAVGNENDSRGLNVCHRTVRVCAARVYLVRGERVASSVCCAAPCGSRRTDGVRGHRVEIQARDGRLHVIHGENLPDGFVTSAGYGHKCKHIAQILLRPQSIRRLSALSVSTKSSVVRTDERIAANRCHYSADARNARTTCS